jgi:cytoskeletal protein CcmA (bactofilin family)
MSDQLLNDRAFINSIVGEGTSFKGELKLTGLLRIDGDFVGSINTEGKVLIGKKGRAHCSIVAGTVIVGGILKGNVTSSEKVIVLSTGMIIGNVTTPRMVVEDGVLLHGNCLITPSPSQGSLSKPPQEPVREPEPSVFQRSYEQPDNGYSRPENRREIYSWKG